MSLFQPDSSRSGGFEVVSSNVLYSDLNASYYRLELFSPYYDKAALASLIEERSPGLHFKLREDLSLYERPLVEVQPRPGLEFRKSFMATSPIAVETAQKHLLPQRSSLDNIKLTKKRIGLISDGSALEKPHQVTFQLERDGYLLARHIGVQATPLWLETDNEEQLLRSIVSLAPNFFALRLSSLNVRYALELSERIAENISIPMIHAEFTETAIIIAAILKNAARFNGVELKNKSAGIIGLNASGHGLARILNRLGLKRIYGIDSDSRQLTYFEKMDGMASSLDHIYDTADFVIISPDYPTKLDEERFHKGQVVLSFSPDVLDISKLRARGVAAYQDHAPHPVFILPGLVAAIQMGKIVSADLDNCMKLMETLESRGDGWQFLPIPSQDLIKAQVDSLSLSESA